MRATLALFTVGCMATSAPTASTELATPSPEALRIVDELNEWCSHGDDCDVAMRREAYPGRVAAGETNGWISSHRERLHELGVEVVWSANHFVQRK